MRSRDSSRSFDLQILIEDAVRTSEIARSAARNAGGAEVLYLSAPEIEARLAALPPAEWKRVLAVRKYRGLAFRPCQGKKEEYACCRLHTLTLGNHCPLECTYCALQYYMETSRLSVFANAEEIEDQVARALSSQPRRIFRVTSGELGDSLALDPLTDGARRWIRLFRELKNGILELKTKTDSIENVLEEEGGGKVVVSWSVNPPEIAEREELRAASLDDRLKAAASVARRGYPVGFHLDPIVRYPGWERAYGDLIDSLFDAVPPERVAWVSIGALRFPFEVASRMAERFPGSKLRLGEFVATADGKLRYPRPLRIEMYRYSVERLRARLKGCSSPPVIYLCMERADVWSKVFGGRGPTSAEVDFLFAGSYARRFPEAELPGPRLEEYL